MIDKLEYQRWIRAARKALISAVGDMERGEYNWACFKAQQSAEFAVKALLHGLGLPAFGHSISSLLEKTPKELEQGEELMQHAKTLDKYYVPTRYPNAWAEGSPDEYYTKNDASNAVKSAETIIKWVEDAWTSLKKES